MRPTARVVFATCLLAFALSFAAQAQPVRGEVPLTFHPRISDDALEPGDALLWPTTFGVPFPQGALGDAAGLRLLSEAGEEIPVQAQITGTWPDGSVRWVLVDAQVPLGAEPAPYRLEWGEGVAATAEPRHQVRVTETDAAVALDTGVLRLALSKQDMSVFLSAESLFLDNWRPAFPPGAAGEIVVEDQDGKRHLGSLAPPPDVTVEEAGPLRATVKIEGWTQAEDGAKLGRHIVRVQAFAGLSWVRVYHTFVKTADSEDVQYRNIALHLPFFGDMAIFNDEFDTMDLPLDDQAPFSAPKRLLQYRQNRSEIFYGDVRRRLELGRSSGSVTVGGAEGTSSISFTARHFWQNFPKEIEVLPGSLRFHVWPRHGKPAEFVGDKMTAKNVGFLWWVHEGETLDFRVPERVYDFSYGGREDNILAARRANAFGVAKTHELALFFPSMEPPLRLTPRGMGAVCPNAFQAGPLMVADPQWLAASGAFFHIAPRNEHYAELEDALEKTLLFLPAMMERIGDFGMWNFGAYHQTYNPALDSAHLHRHWKGFHHGGPRWPWLNFARSGNPEVFDFAEAHSRYQMDVGVCNWEDPAYNERYWDGDRWWGHNTSLKYLGGLCRYKGLVHWYAGMRMFYNAQVDFALWHYYLTGYRRAWDVAMNMGEFLLRANQMIDDPDTHRVFGARGGTGRGAMAITLYHATHDERYLELAREQMQLFMDQDDEEPETGYRNIYYAPFVERYWEATGDEALKPYIERWARKRLEEPGVWSGRDPYYNLMALGYRLTGDAAFLHRGLAEARALLENRGANADPVLDGVLIASYAGGPGYAAQQWGHFAKALDEHYERTGERLLIPDALDARPFPVTFRSLRGQRHEDGSRFHRLVFHVRKAEGEAVSVGFPFRTNNTVATEVLAPDGTAFKRATKEPDGGRVGFEVEIAPGDPAGDYRIEFYCREPLRHDLLTSWPLPGNYRKLVLEMPFDARSPGRFYFMPSGTPADGEAGLRLRTQIRNRYFNTHRIYRPGGGLALAITEQGHVNAPLNKVFQAAAEDRGRVWLYSGSSFGSGDGAWFEGDVHPVASFEREMFFVPERFAGQ